jgi:hypothetical protein
MRASSSCSRNAISSALDKSSERSHFVQAKVPRRSSLHQCSLCFYQIEQKIHDSGIASAINAVNGSSFVTLLHKHAQL